MYVGTDVDGYAVRFMLVEGMMVRMWCREGDIMRRGLEFVEGEGGEGLMVF